MPSKENLEQALAFKEEGNGYLKSGDPVRAIKPYTQAIHLTNNDETLYSNRAFAFSKAGKYERALLDADRAVHLKPLWHKGHFRRGEALRLAGLHAKSLEAYTQAAKLDPSDEHLAACVQNATENAHKDVAFATQIVYFGAAIGAILACLILYSGATGSMMSAIVFGALGGPLGYMARMCWEEKRQWAVAAPTMSNEDFVKSQFSTLQLPNNKKTDKFAADADASTGGSDSGRKARTKVSAREAAMRSKAK